MINVILLFFVDKIGKSIVKLINRLYLGFKELRPCSGHVMFSVMD